MIVTEHLTPDCGVIVLVQPICNLLEVQSFMMKFENRVVQELLIFRITSNEKIPCLQNHLETEVNIYVIWG